MTEFETPGRAIQKELDQRGWTHDDLARLIGKHRPEITALISDKRGVTPEIAVALGAAFGDGAERWMHIDAMHRLSLVRSDPNEISRRKRLYDLAPIREMEKRGWIKPSESLEELGRELQTFFDIRNLEEEPSIGGATRKSDSGEPLTSSQRAWCFRVRQLAKMQMVSEFRVSELERCARELRRLAAYPQEIYKVPRVLESFGVRFVIVEPLSSSKVDGVAVWLDEDSPAIGMSLRYDRIDSFWFTLSHEFVHILHRHDAPLDSDLTDRTEGISTLRATTEIERIANEEGAALLIPRDELRSFILRVGPYYSKARIIQFAHRVKIHPGIIVGQLQHKDEIGYSAHREMLAKIRDTITASAITDGWGQRVFQ